MSIKCGMSEFYREKVANALLKGTVFTLPAAWLLALYTTPIKASDAVGTPTEVAGGAYARTAIVFGDWSRGFSYNTGVVTFPTPTADWGTIKGIAIVDAASVGNIIFFANICAKKISNGDTPYTRAINSIRVALGGGC